MSLTPSLIPSIQNTMSSGLSSGGYTSGDVEVPQPNITGWEQVGNTSASIDTHAYMMPLNETDVAILEFNNSVLSTYTFDGTDWTLKGSTYDLTLSNAFGGASADGGCKIADNKIAWLDHSGDEIGVYSWNGTDTWTEEHYADYTALFDQAGYPSGTLMAENKAIIAMGNTSGDTEVRILEYNGSDDFTLLGDPLTTYASTYLMPIGLSATTAAVHDDAAETLTMYSFDGTDWTVVGNPLTVTAEVGRKQGCALSSNRVVIWGGSGVIQAYEFDGTDWAALGAGINTGATSWPNVIVPLSPTRIAVKSYAGGWIKTYDATVSDE